jgi:hypothetical protein
MSKETSDRLIAAIRNRQASWTGPPRFWMRDENTATKAARAVASRVAAWADPATAPVYERVVSFYPDADEDALAAAQRLLANSGAVVLEKDSNEFGDALVVLASQATLKALKEMPGVHTVTSRPELGLDNTEAGSPGGDALVFPAPRTGSAPCSAADAARGATRLSVLPTEARAVLNDAEGVLVIVWDDPPSEVAKLGEELTSRKGGAVKVYENSKQSMASGHGSSVASICCGESAGFAKGAALAIVTTQAKIKQELSVIRTLLRVHGGPAVVNMSFSIKFLWARGDAKQKEYSIAQAAALDDIVVSILEEHSQPLLFVTSAGNDALVRCGGVLQLPEEGYEYVAWPSPRNVGGRDLYLVVGATEVYEASGRVAQRMAEYSNFGSCVGALCRSSAGCWRWRWPRGASGAARAARRRPWQSSWRTRSLSRACRRAPRRPSRRCRSRWPARSSRRASLRESCPTRRN